MDMEPFQSKILALFPVESVLFSSGCKDLFAPLVSSQVVKGETNRCSQGVAKASPSFQSQPLPLPLPLPLPVSPVLIYPCTPVPGLYMGSRDQSLCLRSKHSTSLSLLLSPFSHLNCERKHFSGSFSVICFGKPNV